MCPKEHAGQLTIPIKHGNALKVAARLEPRSALKLNLNPTATLLPHPASNVPSPRGVYLHFRAVYS